MQHALPNLFSDPFFHSVSKLDNWIITCVHSKHVFFQIFPRYLFFPSTKEWLVMRFDALTGFVCEDLWCQ